MLVYGSKSMRDRDRLARENGLTSVNELTSGFGETFMANLYSVREAEWADSYSRTILPQVDEQLGKLGELLGDDSLLPYRDGNGRPTSRWTSDRRFEPARAEEMLRRHRDVIGATPGLKTLEEIADEAGATAMRMEAEADYLAARGSGFAAFAGQLAGYMLDPVNLLTLPLGGVNSGGVLAKTLGRAGIKLAEGGAAARILTQAGIEAGTEALIQTGVASHKRRIGMEHGAADVAAGIGFAALGGGVFEAAGIGLAKAYRKAVGEGKVKATPEADSAADAIEQNAVLEATNPTAGAPGSGKAHAQRLQTATNDVLEGRPTKVSHFASEAEQRVLLLRDTLDDIRKGITQGSGARIERVRGAFAAEREALTWLHAAEAQLARQSELFGAGRVVDDVVVGPGAKPWKRKKDAEEFARRQKVFSGEAEVVKQGRGFGVRFKAAEVAEEIPAAKLDAPEAEAPALLTVKDDPETPRAFGNKGAATRYLNKNRDELGPDAAVVELPDGKAGIRLREEAPAEPVTTPGPTGKPVQGIEKQTADPQPGPAPEAVEAEAARVLEADPEAGVPTGAFDSDGKPVTRPLREVMEELDTEAELLAEVQSCMLSRGTS